MTAICALETSTARGSVALSVGGAVTEAELARERAHASDVLPALDRLLAAAGLAVRDLDAVAVGLGPGSFTGLRVAAATALGLARGAGLALVGVPSFAAAALDALAPGETGAVIQDARSGAFYFARYARERGPDALFELDPPVALTAAEIRERLAATDVICGDAAAVAALEGEASPVLSRSAEPRARAVLVLGAARLARFGPTPPAELEPLYLRPFLARRRGS